MVETKKITYSEEKHEWLHEISFEMGVPGKTDQAYKVLKSVLHAFRDKLDF